MGSNWQELTIGDVCYVTDGAHSKVDRVPMGVMYLTSKNISNGTLKLENFDYISEESHIKLFTDTNRAQRKLRVGDVLMGIIGTFGNCYVYSENDHFGISSSVAILRANQDILIPEYLYYVISSEKFKSIVEKYKGGSVQGYTNVSTIKALPISIPSVDEQRKIVKLLLPNDKKIELNKQTNQTLEKMAQTLFKSWFVDFDPVFDNALAKADFNLEALPSAWPEALLQRATSRLQVLQHNPALQAKLTQPNQAETENNTAPEQISQAENTHQHFPSEFEPTDEPSIGINSWIPKGWSPVNFESLINLTGGGTPKTSVEEYWNGDIPWFSVVDAPNDSDVFVIETDKHVTQLGVDKSSTKILRSGTTIISARGTVGKCALVAGPMAMNQSCYGINGKNDISDEFIYFLTRYQVADLQKRGHGSVFNTITRETFKSIILPFSGELLTNEFSKIVSLLFEKVLNNNMQNIELTKLRDTLLPKLISGELQIPDDTIVTAKEA